MLSRWGCWLCADGLIYGARYCVNVVPNGFPPGSEDGCLGSTAYNRSVDRRADWCNKQCTGPHVRPAGLQEKDIQVIDLLATDLSVADAAVAARVQASKGSWRLLAGVDDKSKVMGKPASASTATAVVPYVASRGGYTNGKGGARRGGRGKGDGRSPIAKPGKGKGKGGKGKGKGAQGYPHFQRQY